MPGTTGAGGINKPQKFFEPAPGQPATSASYDDDGSDGWWGGTMRCMAGIAIAGSLAISLNILQGTSQAISLVPDEDFWQNPVAPVQAQNYIRLPLGDPEEIPGNLHSPFEEDSYIPRIPPGGRTLYTQLPLGDPEEIPAGSLHSPFEEDAFFPWVYPYPPIVWPQQFNFDTPEAVPQAVAFQPDEDFWTNPVPPVQSINRAPIFTDDDFVQFIVVDEDVWLQSVPYVASLAPQPFQFDDNYAPYLGVDEDYSWTALLQYFAAPLLPQLSADDDFVQQATTPLPFDEEFNWLLFQPQLFVQSPLPPLAAMSDDGPFAIRPPQPTGAEPGQTWIGFEFEIASGTTLGY